MTHAPIDFAALAAALLRDAETWLARWLPNGTCRNGRWYVGDFDGSPGESANVNLDTGQWIDNAAPDDEKGGDLISLYARVRGLNNSQAARELMEQMGWTVQTPAPHRLARGEAPPQPPADDEAPPADAAPPTPRSRSAWRPIVPVPTHAPAPKFRFAFKDKKGGRWVELDAVRTWAYAFEGQRFGHVARFERIDSAGQLVKDTLPLTWCEDTSDGRGSQRWHWKAWDAPRPLYVPAALLSADLSRPVVVVEGEKCAQAGHELLGQEFDFVSWPGGSKAWAYAGWGWLMGRTVVLWPDADAKRLRLTKAEREAGADPATKDLQPAHKQPGMQAMVGIGSLLVADQGCTVHLCKIPAPGDVADGWDIADAIEQGWTADQVREFIRAAAVFVPPDDAARAKAVATPVLAGAGSDDDSDAWRSKLLQSAKGATLACRENAVLALDGLPERGIPGAPAAMGVIAFNEFTNDVVKLKAAPWGTPPGVWDEVDELEMGNWLTRELWLPPMPRGTLEEAVLMVAKRHRYHPVRERIERLRGTWDETKRLATWLRRVCMVPDEFDDADPLQQYLSRVGTWLVMALCARVLMPGCKFDYMVIFEGPQGVGKSTLASVLGGDFYADTGLVLGEKDSYQNLQGIAVYEWGELDALSKNEVTKVKLFISSQKDRFRASFDRRAKDYPRQVVFIGTTNEDRYLSDPTGNRRFWPVRVARQVDIDWVREHRDQLFAEALVYLDAGDRFHPTLREQRALFDPQQEQRTVDSALEAAIVDYLYNDQQRVPLGGHNGSLVNEISLSDLVGRIGYPLDKRTDVVMRRAAAAMRRRGWVIGRSSVPPRPWVYRRPKEPAGPAAGASQSSTAQHDAAAIPAGADDDCPF